MELFASIVLPVYNGEKTLRAQLEALERQTWTTDAEIVVVDNGSTDGSVALVEEFRNRLPNLSVVPAHDWSGPRKGVDHSYRTGFAAARGDVILLCEADDEVADDWFATLMAALVEHPFVAAARDPVPLNDPAIAATFTAQRTGLIRDVAPLWSVPWAFGCAIGLRREVLDAVGGPADDCGTSWDIDFCWRAHRAGFPLRFVPEAVVRYRLRHGSRARFRQGMTWGRSEVLLQRKHGHRSVPRYVAREGWRTARCVAKGAAILIGGGSLEPWVFELGLHLGRLGNIVELLRIT